MSKSRSRSRTRSRTRSRSRSRSRSPSTSRSRSRSRKHRYSSGSRSRSRSHSPPHSRDGKFQRGYHHGNSREFRGYHRGFRRPYYFRGRGRGYFPRGRYQRGGEGGCNNNNFRPNWKNYRQYPQQQQHPPEQQQQLQQQNNQSRGRPHSPKKRPGSPPQQGARSHPADRSLTPASRRTRRSSSVSRSSSASPKCRPASGPAKSGGEEQPCSKEVPKGGGGEGGESVELPGLEAGRVDAGCAGGKTGASWQGITDVSTGPSKASHLACTAVGAGQTTPAANQSSPARKITAAASNGALSWQIAGSSSRSKSPSQESPAPKFSSFGFFSKDNSLDETAVSTAFKQFLEVNGNQAAKSARENGKNTEANDMHVEQSTGNGKLPVGMFGSISRRHKEDSDDVVSLNSFLKASPFASVDGEDAVENKAKPLPMMFCTNWHNGGESSKPKGQVSPRNNDLFEERFGRWESLTYPQAARGNRLDAVAGEMYRGQTHNKAATIAAAFPKREMGGISPERGAKSKVETLSSHLSLSTLPPKRILNSERFIVRGEDSPPEASRNTEAQFNIRMNLLGDSLTSCDVLAGERQLSQDLVQSCKKEQEFRCIFHHVQAAKIQRSPSEIFAQHIVTIVHHITAQHFPASGMTLNERFSIYQRRTAEKEMMQPRKSPEIHRRIDVSPSAFKKHSQLFEAMKSTEDGSYKDGGENVKGDTMDLRLDIERRKQCVAREYDYNLDGGRGLADPPTHSSKEKSSKRHKKSKKSKKKRSRSTSSSSSSSSKSHKEKHCRHSKPDSKDEGFIKAQLSPRDSIGPVESPCGVLQFRVQGRGLSSENCQGNHTTGNPLTMSSHANKEDWDPEYTPKSKKYYLHDDRNIKWLDNHGQGRGNGSFLHGTGRPRFIVRKATTGNSNNSSSPKWVHDRFLVNGEPADMGDEDSDHKEEGPDAGRENT